LWKSKAYKAQSSRKTLQLNFSIQEKWIRKKSSKKFLSSFSQIFISIKAFKNPERENSQKIGNLKKQVCLKKRTFFWKSYHVPKILKRTSCLFSWTLKLAGQVDFRVKY
jgi:hypothetical protein